MPDKANSSCCDVYVRTASGIVGLQCKLTKAEKASDGETWSSIAEELVKGLPLADADGSAAEQLHYTFVVCSHAYNPKITGWQDGAVRVATGAGQRQLLKALRSKSARATAAPYYATVLQQETGSLQVLLLGSGAGKLGLEGLLGKGALEVVLQAASTSDETVLARALLLL